MRVPTCPARIGPSWTVTSESGVEPNLRKCANSSRDRDYHALYQGPTLVGPLNFLHFWLGGGGLNELKELDLGS
jgi:hypothetical protein